MGHSLLTMMDPPDVPLTSDDYEQLCIQIDPVQLSSEYGLDVYARTIQYVYSHIS